MPHLKSKSDNRFTPIEKSPIRQETCELRRVFALRSGSILACRMNGGNSEAKAATLGCILPPGFSAGTDGARHGAAVRLEDLTLV